MAVHDHVRSGKSLLAIVLVAGVIVTAMVASLSSMIQLTVAASDGTVTAIQNETSVVVSPAAYSFENMNQGQTNFSDMEPLQLIIENNGSTNITNIYATVDTLETEPENPIGSSDAEDYAAGGFMFIKGASGPMYHAGRLSWNITEDAGGKPAGVTRGDNNAVSYGFYRNASNGYYLWSLGGNGTITVDSYCDRTGNGAPELYMKTVPDDGTNRDLSNDSSTVIYRLSSASENWAGTKAQGGPLDGHYVAAWRDCSKFYIYRYDASPSLPRSSDEEHYLVGPSSDEYLAPNETFTGRIGAAVPRGVPQGDTKQSELTIHASSVD